MLGHDAIKIQRRNCSANNENNVIQTEQSASQNKWEKKHPHPEKAEKELRGKEIIRERHKARKNYGNV